LQQARQQFAQTQQAARVFKDFTYRTHKSWSRARRVVGKAEHLAQGPNPRCVATSLAADAYPALALEDCARVGRRVALRPWNASGRGPAEAMQRSASPCHAISSLATWPTPGDDRFDSVRQ